MGSGQSAAKVKAGASTPRPGGCLKDTESGSAEAFDRTCDVCKDFEKEAVEFCDQCKKYLCDKCRKYHNHSKVDKITNIESKSDVGFFTRNLVPVSLEAIPCGYHGETEENRVTCIANPPSSANIFILDAQPDCLFMKLMKADGSSRINSLGSEHIQDITCLSTSKDKVLFTRSYNNCVEKYTFNDKSPIKLFTTSGWCYGIAEFDDGFAVSVYLGFGYSLPDWQIQYLDKKGNIKKQIYYDTEGQPLFSHPIFLASNLSKTILYVSDHNKHAIIALNVDGVVVYTFQHDDMKSPLALTVDVEDNVYVACSNKLIQIDKSGTEHRVLILKKQFSPDITSVCFNHANHTLIVGEASDEIKTFNFLP